MICVNYLQCARAKKDGKYNFFLFPVYTCYKIVVLRQTNRRLIARLALSLIAYSLPQTRQTARPLALVVEIPPPESWVANKVDEKCRKGFRKDCRKHGIFFQTPRAVDADTLQNQ